MTGEQSAGLDVDLGGVQSAGTTLDAQTVTALFDALSHPTRRHVLRYVMARDGAVTVTELAENLARRDGFSVDETTEHLRVALLHTHLPKLGDLDLVEVDDHPPSADSPESRSVTLTDRGVNVAENLYA